MNNDAIMSACPVVDHERGTFGRIFDVSHGRGIYKAVPFDSDVEWLREGHYRLALYNPEGKLLKEGCSTGDYHQFLMGYRDPFEAAARFADDFGVSMSSPNSVEVRMTVIERPVYEVEDPIVYRNAKRYRTIPSGWFRYDPVKVAEWKEAKARSEFYDGFDRIETRTVFEDTIWTSRLGSKKQDQFPALINAFARALEGVDDVAAAEALGRLDAFMGVKVAA